VRACGPPCPQRRSQSVASGHPHLCVYMVPSQDEFDGINTTLVYPGSRLATDLDNNLWLPYIATYDAHHTTSVCTLSNHMPWAQVQLGSTRLNPAPRGFAGTGMCTTRRRAF